MANPLPVDLTKDVWVKVATAVQAGQVWIKSNAPRMYKHTYVLTGGAAPTDDTTAHELISGRIPISAKEDIDVYFKAVGKDGRLIVEV